MYAYEAVGGVVGVATKQTSDEKYLVTLAPRLQTLHL